MAFRPKSDFLVVLMERGFLQDCTDLEGLDARLRTGVVPAYIGYDATAQSLHVGHLLNIMLLRWLQATGHKPITLMGGGTTKVGDPSFRSDERPLLSAEAIAGNIASLKTVFSKYLRYGEGTGDAIMLDNAVKLARDWAKARGDDTLILVVADHNHPISLIGTIDDDMTAAPKAPLRERIGAYDKAGFPNYPPPDRDGYPPRVDVGKRLAIFSASSPDYYETFRPKLDDPNDPTVAGATKGTVEPNTRYRDQPGAMLRLGNLPKYMGASVHSGEDVILTATGPGSERVRGQIDNTEVFRIMAEALGLGHGE